jgi:hypothetical protein
MRITWEEPANEGLSLISDGHRGAVRDRVVNWVNGANGWNPRSQSISFRVGTMEYRAEAQFTPPDSVTVSRIEAP